MRIVSTRRPERDSLYARVVAIPEPMLSTRAAVWPTDGDWVMEPKWDGFRLLVEIDSEGRIRAWSRHGTSLSEHLGGLLEPLLHAPRASIFDAELIALSSRNHGVVQDFAAVCERLCSAAP